MKEKIKKPIVLKLKAKHFKNTNFIGKAGNQDVSINGCAIEKAAAEFFKTERVSEYVHSLKVENTEYSHIFYGESIFIIDKNKAKDSKHPNKIIREIELWNN